MPRPGRNRKNDQAETRSPPILAIGMVTMRPTTRADYARRILRVLVHIQQNLDRALPLEDLASVANFSPFHFHRVFTGMVMSSENRTILFPPKTHARSASSLGTLMVQTVPPSPPVTPAAPA